MSKQIRVINVSTVADTARTGVSWIAAYRQDGGEPAYICEIMIVSGVNCERYDLNDEGLTHNGLDDCVQDASVSWIYNRSSQ